ncbi:MAG: GNAT family N-acetyltransferase [Candidatus Lokiarchaeota archaeon]|nr:GNAT family N-acetyltransferase [Candidatus Lokiarchaeota archaeon]
MGNKYAEGKIRDFELTMEDAARVAECFNSFDDSDSWPGGFTHGNPFTAERIYESAKKSDDMRILVAYVEDKIVGYCNVCEGFYDPESAYVGLLGVNPHYQGQGFGKALLIEAAETAARAGKRRIDLHTWGGNLKALPLYKRVGYNWMPGTRVLMEGHIPGILNFPLFKEFFNRYYWYDAFKREIRQEPDDLVLEGIGLFKYRFEGDDGDSLTVMIDREAKGICGFELIMDSQTISAHLKPTSHTGYIGGDAVPIELVIINETAENIQYSINVTSTKELVANLTGQSSGVIQQGKETKVNGTYKIPFGVAPLDKDDAADEKVKSWAEWKLTINGTTVSLFAGLIPTEAIKITSTPEYPSIFPSMSTDLAIGFENTTKEDIQLEVVVTAEKSCRLDETTYSISLSALESKEITTTIHDTGQSRNFVSVVISVFKSDRKTQGLIARKTLKIPKKQQGIAFAYHAMGEHIVLENDQVRYRFTNKIPLICRYIERKTVGDYIEGWMFGISLGLPFPREGDEWTRKDLDIEVSNTPDYAEITVTGDSDDKPGLRYTQRYRLYSKKSILEVSATLTNVGKEPIEKLGLSCGGWIDYRSQMMTVPVRSGIYQLKDPSWGAGGLPDKPDYYSEQWFSMYDMSANSTLGFMWEKEHLEKIFLSGNVPRPEYILPILQPGESKTYLILKSTTKSGDWRTIRSMWAKENNIDLEGKPPTPIIDQLSVELSNPDSRISSKSGSPLFVDRAKPNDVQLTVKVIQKEPIVAKIRIIPPDGILINGKTNYEMNSEISIEKPLKKALSITVEDGDWLRVEGKIEFTFAEHIVRRQFSVIVFDSKQEAKKQSETIENQRLFTLSTSECSIGVSPDHRGSLVRYTNKEGESVLLDRFPDSGPYVWWDRFFSGVSPILFDKRVWDWETKFSKEEWEAEYQKYEPWAGYEVSSILEYSAGIKGFEISARYLLLKGTNLVQARLQVKNTINITKTVKMGFKASPKLDQSHLSNIHTILLGTHLTHEPVSMRTSFKSDAEESWAAFENSITGQVLGVISTEKQRSNLFVETISDEAQLFRFLDLKKVRPGEEKTFICYLLITDSVEKVQLLKNLPDIV